MNEKMIIDAYCKIRKIDNTISDEVLDFMKEAAIDKINVKNKINLLIEDYERRLKTISETINGCSNNGSIDDEKKMERLRTKQSEYRTFLSELTHETT